MPDNPLAPNNLLLGLIANAITAVLTAIAVFLIWPLTVVGTIIVAVLLLLTLFAWFFSGTAKGKFISIIFALLAVITATLFPFIVGTLPNYILVATNKNLWGASLATVRNKGEAVATRIVLADPIRSYVADLLQEQFPFRFRVIDQFSKEGTSFFQLPLRSRITIPDKGGVKDGRTVSLSFVSSDQPSVGIAISRDMTLVSLVPAVSHESLTPWVEDGPIQEIPWRSIQITGNDIYATVQFVAFIDLAIEAFAAGRSAEAARLILRARELLGQRKISVRDEELARLALLEARFAKILLRNNVGALQALIYINKAIPLIERTVLRRSRDKWTPLDRWLISEVREMASVFAPELKNTRRQIKLAVGKPSSRSTEVPDDAKELRFVDFSRSILRNATPSEIFEKFDQIQKLSFDRRAQKSFLSPVSVLQEALESGQDNKIDEILLGECSDQIVLLLAAQRHLNSITRPFWGIQPLMGLKPLKNMRTQSEPKLKRIRSVVSKAAHCHPYLARGMTLLDEYMFGKSGFVANLVDLYKMPREASQPRRLSQAKRMVAMLKPMSNDPQVAWAVRATEALIRIGAEKPNQGITAEDVKKLSDTLDAGSEQGIEHWSDPQVAQHIFLQILAGSTRAPFTMKSSGSLAGLCNVKVDKLPICVAGEIVLPAVFALFVRLKRDEVGPGKARQPGLLADVERKFKEIGTIGAEQVPKLPRLE